MTTSRTSKGVVRADDGVRADDLRWFVRLRWFAGALLVVATGLDALVSGLDRRHGVLLGIGAAVLGVNALLGRRLQRRPAELASARGVQLQIALDLAAITGVVLLTGGIHGPLVALYVLHLILAGLLLAPRMPYLAAMVALAMLLGGLAVTGQLTADPVEIRAELGWALVLLVAAHLTSRLSSMLRSREREAVRERERLRSIVETAADGIFVIDEVGTIVSANPAAERMFGYDAAEMRGRGVEMLMPEPDRGRHAGYLSRYLRTGESAIIGVGREVQGRRRDGSLFPVELAVSELTYDGRRFFTGILRDATERKRVEHELRRVNERLQHDQAMLVQAEKLRAMGEMAAGVVHEIANPLASMDSLLELVQRQPARLTPDTGRMLRDQVARIERIVRQLTGFAHPGEAAWEEASLNEVVGSALDLLRFDRRMRGVELVRELDPDLPAFSMLRGAIQQVVLNLVINAVDALEGRPNARIVVRTARDGEACMLTVADNGPGIDPAILSRIAEPFFTTKPPGRGTGLGLSICDSLVARHGGRCDVRSVPGEGAVFEVHLPLARSADAEPGGGA